MNPTDDLACFSMMLQRLAPGVGALGTLELVDVGYGATTLRSTSGVAVRIPHTERQAMRQQAMTSPLGRLAALLPVAIPKPLWTIPMGHPFDLGATGYAWLPGEPLEPPDYTPALADQVGAFLATLHDVDITSFVGKFRDRVTVDADRERMMSVSLAWLGDMEPAPVVERLERWWDRYRAARAEATYQPRVIHGDFWYGNLLFDTDRQRLVGVIDWEEVSVDDPAQDLATLLHTGDDVAEQILRAYQDHGGTVDAATRERMRWHWEFREFTGIALALEVGNEVEAQDAARKLREGPLRPLFEVSP